MGIDLHTYRVRVGHFASLQMSCKGLACFTTFELITWLSMLLLRAGDIHQNPGPKTITSDSPDSTLSDSNMFEDFRNSLSFVHYNVQSFFHKRDILQAELKHFDVLSFSETWLSDQIDSSSLIFENFAPPFRKDRNGDNHGGVIVYVRSLLPAIRRTDLELDGTECIWLEIQIKHKKVLFGTFYRPPNSPPIVLTQIENSIGLAYDTSISDIIVTGDFNLDINKPATRSKIQDLIIHFTMKQVIDESTHFTEHSNSLIDLFLLSSTCPIKSSGVGEPFLDQNIRYHCPVFCCLDIAKPKSMSFKRRVWKFDEGDYQSLRRAASIFDWQSLFDNNIDTYTSNITNEIMTMSNKYIPNKVVTIRQTEPPWIHNDIRKHIRKRKRAYDKAKRSQNPIHWQAYKQLRNKTTDMVRHAKHHLSQKIADKLKQPDLKITDYWKILKQFISPTKKSSIDILHDNGNIITDNTDKANLLNNFFQTQTQLNDQDKLLPSLQTNRDANVLCNIQITEEEVESTLKSLSTGKASGPDNINSRILKELSHELASPLCALFNRSLYMAKVPSLWKLANVCAIHKKTIHIQCQITDLFLYLALSVKHLKK